MSVFQDDRATFTTEAQQFDQQLGACGLDGALQQAFESGMELDEIMYVLATHTERTVRRYIVQYQLKRAANKDKV